MNNADSVCNRTDGKFKHTQAVHSIIRQIDLHLFCVMSVTHPYIFIVFSSTPVN